MAKRRMRILYPFSLLLAQLAFIPSGSGSRRALALEASPTSVEQAPARVSSPPGQLRVPITGGSPSDHRADVDKFYTSGGFALAWIHEGQPTAQAKALIQLFKDASLKGLRPDDYDSSHWDARLALLGPSNPQPADNDQVQFDRTLTACAMRYVADLRIGRVNPQPTKFTVDFGSMSYDLADFLRNQVIEASDVGAAMASVEPHYAGYQRAEAALAVYSKLAASGDGASLPIPVTAVRPGDTYSGTAVLVSRLRQLGDLAPHAAAPDDTTVYEGAIVDAVGHFQQRQGLQADGVLGKETVMQLNLPLSRRVKQLEFTLERYRWIPSKFPQPPIVVNLPEFRLRTMRRQPAPFLSMRVVVGKAYGHQTPVFADYMRYLIFRPYWNVPMSIQFAELVPKIRRDRNYLADHGFEVATNSGTVVTDGTVNDDILSQLRSGSLTVRQKPGPKNALGLVKFIFPNHYNVYLHSTPAPELFLKARRDFSHGCIRVEDPVGLAAWVLRDRPEWTIDKIRAAMNDDQTVQVNLGQPIPILIIYSTAVVEPDGEVHFFKDIYGYDSMMDRALAGGYPYSRPAVSSVDGADE